MEACIFFKMNKIGLICWVCVFLGNKLWSSQLEKKEVQLMELCAAVCKANPETTCVANIKVYSALCLLERLLLLDLKFNKGCNVLRCQWSSGFLYPHFSNSTAT